MKVFISAGHGGSDPGAIANGLKEKVINLNIAMSCGAFLEAHGIKVVYSRTTDEHDPVGEEVNEANASNADIAVSFHNNAGGGDGCEVYYYNNDTKGKKLATYLLKASSGLGQNSRGIKSTVSLYFIKKTKMTACLVETAFLDSNDRFIIDEVEEQKNFGIAYAKAIMNYLGIEEVKNEPKTSSESTGEFLIKAKVQLSVRRGPGVEYGRVGIIDSTFKYTIIKTAKAADGGTWGYLKSGMGWVNIGSVYCTRY